MRFSLRSYANTLYLHAINTILPPVMPGTEATAPEPSLDEVCRGAISPTGLFTFRAHMLIPAFSPASVVLQELTYVSLRPLISTASRPVADPSSFPLS